MKKIIEITWLLVVLVVLCSGQELEDERNFSYIRGSKTGPERWGFLYDDWAACKDGRMQSPINLPNLQPQVVPKQNQLSYFYYPANATLKNRGHDIEVKWAQGISKIRINSREFILKQCHWHTPSEHTISGTRYAMELHLVHQDPNPNAKNRTAVVGILYRLGQPDQFLSKLMDKIRSISDSSQEVPAGVVNPAEAIMGRGRKYYTYMGSLTTPPCSEGVTWIVDTKIGTVSQEQIDLLREAVNDDAAQNARPLQPSNGRKINLYELFRSHD